MGSIKIRINEIFHSIQGEGVNAGLPAIFIRFQGCNLSCPWCDTAHAIAKGSGENLLSIENIIEQISGFNCQHVVITGGEPTAQMAELLELVAALRKQDYSLELETNGLVPLPAESEGDFSQINVGLKLPESSMPLADNYYRQAIDRYGKLPNVSFKIVIGDQGHQDFLTDVLLEQHDLARQKICLMPQGENPEQLQRSAIRVMELCKRENVRFSPRLHILHNIR
jgi:7-carboxy-7-deazaguanine synthase